MFNSESKIRAMKKHIELREQFWEIKYNVFQRAYAMFRMTFHSEELIRKANVGVNTWIADYGTFKEFKKAIEG
jgi:4-alpha-glucanotransferase